MGVWYQKTRGASPAARRPRTQGIASGIARTRARPAEMRERACPPQSAALRNAVPTGCGANRRAPQWFQAEPGRRSVMLQAFHTKARASQACSLYRRWICVRRAAGARRVAMESHAQGCGRVSAVTDGENEGWGGGSSIERTGIGKGLASPERVPTTPWES